MVTQNLRTTSAGAAMTLGDLAQGRNNNFNLIRIVAAFVVLVWHSFPLTLGKGGSELSFGVISMSAMAVDAFFVTSGFLVTGSLLSRQSALDFLWARFLRIFPALWVMVLLTAFGLGLLLTTVAPLTYLTSPLTYTYLAKCLTLVAGVSFQLPGLFDSNPYPHAVNGSLWTLPIEVRMYGILLLAWVGLAKLGQRRPRILATLIVLAAAIAWFLAVGLQLWKPASSTFTRLFFMFFAGAAFHVLKERIQLRRSLFVAGCAAIVLAGAAVPRAFFAVYSLALPFVLFYLAYVPGGMVRQYNRLGDYSYGVYIYAFPVQQAIAFCLPGITPVVMIGLAGPVTLALAALSWHFVEKPALRLKSRAVGRTGALFGRVVQG